MSKLLRLTVVAALAFVGAASLLIQVGQRVAWAAGLEEGRFVELINRTRADLGLPAYRLHSALQTKAAAWAESMAATGSISHSDLALGIAVDWLRLGENVGVGGAVEALHAAFLASPTHHANLVHAGFSYVGVGVVKTGGVIFVAQEFMELQPSLPGLLSGPVAALTSALPPAPAPPGARAALETPPQPAPTPEATASSEATAPAAPPVPPAPSVLTAAPDPPTALLPTLPEAPAAGLPTVPAAPGLEVPAGPLVSGTVSFGADQWGQTPASSPATRRSPAEPASASALPPSLLRGGVRSNRPILASLLPHTLLVLVGLAFRRATADL